MSTQTTRQSSSVLLALALCMALQLTGFVMSLPLFARHFDSFRVGVEALGVSAMAYALTSTITPPFIGMLADPFGRCPIILVLSAGYVLAFSGYLFAASAWPLILIRGLTGVFTEKLTLLRPLKKLSLAITTPQRVHSHAHLTRRSPWYTQCFQLL